MQHMEILLTLQNLPKDNPIPIKTSRLSKCHPNSTLTVHTQQPQSIMLDSVPLLLLLDQFQR